MTHIEGIKNYLSMVAAMRGGAGPEAFYLANGTAFGATVEPIFVGAAKQCFNNAFSAVTSGKTSGEWFYAEGYAVNPNIGIPLNHAWLVNKDGEVMDVSPHWPRDSVYFGVAFRDDYLLRSAIETGYPSPVWTNEMFNEKLSDMDPADYRLEETRA